VAVACTHTITFALMDAWAQTFPSDPPLRLGVVVNEPCSVCGEPLRAYEVCYFVTQLERDENGREPPVCWRHVRPDDGPTLVPRGD